MSEKQYEIKSQIYETENGQVKVTVHSPTNVDPRIRQEKIDRIYDIMKPKN